ncbi:MAG: hypothetical protein M0O93_07585, partial [Bacteroidales bacterium]|nr:hypothetical protein [Bacteroidales bacterium]
MKLLNQISNSLLSIFHPVKEIWRKLNDNNQTYIIIFLLCGLFIGFGYSYIDYEYYYYGVIPILLLLALLFYYRLDKVLYLIAILTPLSLTYLVSETSAMTIPTEPLLILFTLVYIFKFIIDGYTDKRIFTHPISL